MDGANRILNPHLRSKVMSAAEAALLIPSGANVGMSGFTGAGYPKELPTALAKRILDANLHGKKFKIGVWTGASTAPELDGALAMVDAGVLENPKVDAVFGLHLIPAFPVGTIGYRSGAILASGDTFTVKVSGKQTHGGFPWNGIDPIVSTAQIVMGLQTIVSRQMNISKEPVVVSIGSIHGGNRENIIPESVEIGRAHV